MFGEIWIPSRVLSEPSDAAALVLVRTVIENRPVWLQVRDPAPATLTQIDAELDERARWRLPAN